MRKSANDYLTHTMGKWDLQKERIWDKVEPQAIA